MKKNTVKLVGLSFLNGETIQVKQTKKLRQVGKGVRSFIAQMDAAKKRASQSRQLYGSSVLMG